MFWHWRFTACPTIQIVSSVFSTTAEYSRQVWLYSPHHCIMDTLNHMHTCTEGPLLIASETAEASFLWVVNALSKYFYCIGIGKQHLPISPRE